MGLIEKVEQLIDKATVSKEVETLIDNSGLDVEGESVTEKVDELIDYTEAFNYLSSLSFQGTDIESVDLYIKNPVAQNNSMFRSCGNLKYIEGVNTSNSTDIQYFISSTKVEVIKEPLNLTKVKRAGNAFACTTLREIRFFSETIKVSISFVYCSQLSAESIQSIIDGLATVETMQTLTLHTDIIAKLTTEQITTIVNKNWTTG